MLRVWGLGIRIFAVAKHVGLTRLPFLVYRWGRIGWPGVRVRAEPQSVNPALAVPQRDIAVHDAVRRYRIARVGFQSGRNGEVRWLGSRAAAAKEIQAYREAG